MIHHYQNYWAQAGLVSGGIVRIVARFEGRKEKEKII